jgi:hypothetical protein
MRFSDVQNQFGLSDWQMKWIKEKCNRSHRADRWLCYRTNMDGEKELWMYLEGVKWVEEVYLNFDVPYKTAEIEFVKRNIKRLEQELKIGKERVAYRNMYTKELMLYFGKSSRSIYSAVRKLKRSIPDAVLLVKKKTIVSAEGVKWIEQNVYKEKYIENLYDYKRLLQEIKRGLWQEEY